MRYVSMGRSTAQVSALGFGCAAIGGRASKRDSLVALKAAYERGITFYDTARSYGFGESEGLLGEFFRGRRESVVLCTKFGILPSTQGEWKQKLKPAARAALRVFPGLRKTVQRQVGGQLVTGQFTVDTLHNSLETSLRELKTEYVDMLLMHGAPASVLEQDDLLEAMERLVESGKVRAAGISGDVRVIDEYFALRPGVLRTAQFTLNLANMDFAEKTRQNTDLLLVANHPFGGLERVTSTGERLVELRASDDVPHELREKLDPADPQLLPELVLNCILRGTGISAVVPGMMQVQHIESNVRAVEHCRFTDEELELLRTVVASEKALSS
jgi:aryl-alcohol dehydrogenase-like predicted oxidoreductase